MLLKDKRVVVTGAGRGIGLAIVKRLSAEGARVAALDVNGDDALSAAASLGDPGRNLGIACNVADSAAVDRAFAQIKQAFGGVDVLVNNAGLGKGPNDGSDQMYAAQAQRAQSLAKGEVPTVHPDQLIHMSDEGWAYVLAVNLNGAFYCARAAVRLMAEENIAGNIVNIASTSEASGEGPIHYATSKAAIIGFTRSLCRELASRRIRVNAVNPGPTNTPIMQGVPEAVVKGLEASVPLGRMARPEEIAAAVAFLASDEGSYATGSVLTVNGGSYMV